VVLVLKGRQGTGKGTFGREVGGLFGTHFFHATAERQLVGQFNAHLAHVLLLFADEAYYAGDKAAEGALKAMITEPRLPLEYKGRDVVSSPNYLRIVMASNQQWVVPASMDDRRFAVIEVSAAHAQDAAYFSAIHKQLADGGRAALLHHLLHYDARGIDLRKLPSTEARWEQQLRSMTPIQKWWYQRLHSGAVTAIEDRWQEEVLTEDVLRDYLAHAGMAGERRRSTSTEIGIELRQLVPELSKTRNLVKEGGDCKRRWFYRFPPLNTCRAHFVERLRCAVVWPKESAADRRGFTGGVGDLGFDDDGEPPM
jgi:hypothetical protein